MEQRLRDEATIRVINFDTKSSINTITYIKEKRKRLDFFHYYYFDLFVREHTMLPRANKPKEYAISTKIFSTKINSHE